MTQKIGNIVGRIHRVDDDRVVLLGKRGPCHVYFDNAAKDREALRLRVGGPCSVWARKADDGRLVLMPSYGVAR